MLNRKQQSFVNEYLIDKNATQAAIRAGYSERTAKNIAHNLLTKMDIQEAIETALQEQSKRTEITADRVLNELAKIGFADMATYTEWSNSGVTLISSDDLPEDASAAVAEVSETTTKDGGTVRFKLHDKLAALEKIGKHLNMFKEKVELTGDDGGPLEVSIDYRADLISRFDAIAQRRTETDVPGEPD